MLNQITGGQGVVAESYVEAYEKFEEIVEQLRGKEAQRLRHDALEGLIEVNGREVLRRLLQGHMDERSQRRVSEPVIDAQGQTHPHKRMHRRGLKTIFGEISVEREGYGGIGLESLHPLDTELNLPKGLYSHTVSKRVAVAAAKESFDEVIAEITQHSGVEMHKRQVEELAERAAQDFEAFYEQPLASDSPKAKSTGGVLVISVDGKGVPVLNRDLRAHTQAAAAQATPHLKHRASKGEKPHRKRMATVAAVYTVEPWVRLPEQIMNELHPNDTPTAKLAPRPRPQNKRVWASLKHTPQDVIGQAFSEAHQRDPTHTKHWTALVDGNQTQIQALQAEATKRGITLTIILDLIHVLEYLWKAAWVLFDEADPDVEVWINDHLAALLHDRSSLLAAGLRRSATLRGLSPQQREPLDRCADYLLNHRDYLHYDHYLAHGFPIATGVIEGACRHLVKDRMELTGARWGIDSAESVLRLRALCSSGDFDQYWSFHLIQEHKRLHLSRYANRQAPQLAPIPAPPA